MDTGCISELVGNPRPNARLWYVLRERYSIRKARKGIAPARKMIEKAIMKPMVMLKIYSNQNTGSARFETPRARGDVWWLV